MNNYKQAATNNTEPLGSHINSESSASGNLISYIGLKVFASKRVIILSLFPKK